MELVFIVKFKAQEVRDYSYDLVCSTEREKFLVPVRAIGNRPRVTFPDDLQFGSVPVKSTVSKMMFVQNVGLSTAKFCLKTVDNTFSCRSEEYIMEPGSSQMIEVNFSPPAAQYFEKDIEVDFFKGSRCFIKVSGQGENVNVSLSTPSVTVDSCYISLSSQKSFRLINHSDAPITFSWKSFGDSSEENIERQKLLKKFNEMEKMEMTTFLENLQNNDFSYGDFDGNGNQADESLGDEEELNSMPLSARAVEAALIRYTSSVESWHRNCSPFPHNALINLNQ